MAQMCRYLIGTKVSDFVPTEGFDEDEANKRQTEAAERHMDRND